MSSQQVIQSREPVVRADRNDPLNLFGNQRHQTFAYCRFLLLERNPSQPG